MRKDRKDPRKAKRSIEIAEARLAEAKESLEQGINSGAIVLAYTSMFHASRALLFSDGFIEKNHACLAAYIKEEYVKEGKLSQKYFRILKEARFERHEALYGLEIETPKDEVEHLIEAAAEFLEEIKRILKSEI